MTTADMFEKLWNGSAAMADWTASVSQGAITHVAADIIAVHSTYFCGSVTAIRTDAGLILIDTANEETSEKILHVIRSWDDRPIHSIILTHGHVDHTGGIATIDREAQARGLPLPQIIGHRDVARRMDRYRLTHGLNSHIQSRQFRIADYVYPLAHRQPDRIYDDELTLEIGGDTLEIFHARGETDDASFIYCPRQRVLISGDFVIWMFPNAGNPRKVQRHAAEWAGAMRKMMTLDADVLVPGHGPVIFGRERVQQVLGDGAALLEQIVGDTLALLNRGAPLDDILHAVKARPDLLAKPYLRPLYDDPEFVVRGIYHLYAGWFDGQPETLKPPRKSELAMEIAALAGGADRLAARAAELAAQGRTRVALHLAEQALVAAPLDAAIKQTRDEVVKICAESETSLMARAFLTAGP